MFLRACPSDNNGSNEGEESSLVIGTYNLTEVNVSNSEGLNKDGVLSINLLDELSCLDGVLINNADGI